MANNNLLASDSFGSGSLSPNWTKPVGATAMCQVIAGSPNVTEPVATSAQYGQIYTGGITWPKDQSSEVTVQAITNEVNTFVILQVRWQVGANSGYQANIDNNTVQIYRYDAGTPTQISSATGLTLAAGDIWNFQATGTLLNIYQNYKQILSCCVGDATYTSGVPGYAQFSSTAITHTQVSAWRGYGAVQQDGIWQKQGIVIPGIAGSYPIGPVTPSKILYEGNAQILSGTVYKTWFCDGPQSAAAQMWYAESLDGISWTRTASQLSVVSGYVTPGIIKVGSTYYMYAQPGTGLPSSTWAVFTSPDGVNWTLQSSTVLAVGGAGTWDSTGTYSFVPVAIVGGTWYALYTGAKSPFTPYYVNMGLATSSDGLTWTKYVSNPVLQNAYVTQAIVNVGGTYYAWIGSTLLGRGGPIPTIDPLECVRYKSTDLINWTVSAKSLHNSQMFEGVSSLVGQSYISAIIDIGGRAYAYTTSSECDAQAPFLFQIGLAIAPAPIASVLTQNEDAVSQVSTDAFPGGDGPLPGTWTTPVGGTAMQIASHKAEPTITGAKCHAVYTGAAFGADQYSELTIAALGTTSFAFPTVRFSTASVSGYESVFSGPIGSLGTASVAILKITSGVETQIGPSVGCTVQIGDVFRFSVIGNVLSMYQNGFLLLQVQDANSTYTTGNPGFMLQAGTTVTNAQVSSWGGGNANVIPAYPGGAGTTGDMLTVNRWCSRLWG